MTDSLSPPSAELAQTQTVTPNQTAGQLIRAARMAKGMHTALLSVTLKVPVRQLEALEADQYDAFKGPVFVRALASSVCRHLQMDPTPVLALLPPSADRLPLHRPSLEPLTSEKSMRAGRLAFFRSIPIQTVSIAVLMLALIAALLWMPSPSTWSWWPSASKEAVSADQAVQLLPAPEPVTSEPVPAVPAEAIEPTPAAQPPAAAAPVASVPQTVTVAPVSVTSAVPPNTASAGASLGFSATSDSWIEIRNSRNQVLWSRVVHAGESFEVQYPLPLSVVVGRASVVRMTYKGKPFDLSPHTKVTVARFEVKE